MPGSRRRPAPIRRTTIDDISRKGKFDMRADRASRVVAAVAAIAVSAWTTPAVRGQQTAAASVSYWSSSETFAKGSLLLDRMDSDHYQIFAVRRDAPGGVELHTLDTDIVLVLEGAATFVTGGTVTGARSRTPAEMTGSGISGGQARRLAKGDVIVVPNGTPHWFREVSPFIRYFAVKLRQASATPPPAAVHYSEGAAAFGKSGLIFDSPQGRFVRVYALRRDKPLGVELHELDTDLIFGVGGSGTFVTGGSIADLKPLGPNESTGSEIRAGTPRRIEPGSALVVPSKTPHWLQQIDGTLDFFAVKVR
jgi:quercetin dioxygenase-like cupin family protein